MRVYLDEGIFESSTADPLDIIELIRRAKGGRHRILLSPSFKEHDERDLPRIRWLAGHRQDVRQRLTQLLLLSASEASKSASDVPRIVVTDQECSDWETGKLSAPDALLLLQSPLKAIVENRRADWSFLLAMVDPVHRRALRDAVREKWLDVESAGGIDEIVVRLRDLSGPAAKDTAWHIGRLRTWVMFDRDAHVEDPRRPSTSSDQALGLCQNESLQGPWPFPYWQLGRRTIESYLPLESLQNQPSAKNGSDRLSVLRRLRDQHPPEAFAYNMKEGFMKDAHAIKKEDRGKLRDRWEATDSAEDRLDQVPREELPEAWRALPSELVAELLHGFGRNISHAFQQCDDEPLWEEWFRQEYERGPAEQPSPTEIAIQILDLV